MYDIIIGRDEADHEKFGDKGTILLGKHYVQMGRTTSLSNKIFLDVTRSHVFFIVGKRGGGKCVTGDTLVTLSDGTQGYIKDLKEDTQIQSLNEALKIKNCSKSGFYERTVTKILKIQLRSGKEIMLTPEHPLLTLSGWTNAECLNIGARIATPRKIYCAKPKDLPEEEVKLLAYLIAEGHIKKVVLFSNSDEKIVNDFEYSLRPYEAKLTCFGRFNYKVTTYTKRKVLDYNINRDDSGKFAHGSRITHEKTKIRQMLEIHGIFNKLSAEKFVPDSIFRLPSGKLSLFLNRIFSCDGSIYKKKTTWQISYSSISERLIKDIQHLLLRFEIHSKIRSKKQSYELIINGIDLITFLEHIGFYGVKEQKASLALAQMKPKKTNPNLDTIPKELWNYYKPSNWASLGKHLSYKNPKSLRSSIEYSVSRQKLMQIALVEGNERLKQLAGSDIFWDEISSIEEINKETRVYDISVPKLHNFIANDIIIHNSYTMGVIAEGISDLPPEVKQNIAVILLDTMGVYWTMKIANKRDEELLKEWGLKPKPLDIVIYTPIGYYKEYKEKGIPTDNPFSIKPSELEASDWAMTFEISINDPIGVLIEKVINSLRKKKGREYSIEDIISELKNEKDEDSTVREAAINRFLNTESWGVFSEKGTELKDLAEGGKVTVLDVSCYATLNDGWKIKSLVVGLISQKLFIDRMIARKNEEYEEIHKTSNFFGDEETKQEMPLVWLVIDEAHEFLPKEGKTVATDPLITILREGRQPGISLILASQQPGKIHTDVMTQADTVIAHRITAKIDTDALGTLMQSYMREGLTVMLDNLPRVKGAAIIFDDTNEKMYPMRVRPRFTWHGGSSPVAIHETKKDFEF